MSPGCGWELRPVGDGDLLDLGVDLGAPEPQEPPHTRKLWMQIDGLPDKFVYEVLMIWQ